MERIDVAIIALGVVVLAASVVGVALYEPDAESGFLVTYSEVAIEGASETQSATISSGGDGTMTFEVDAERVSTNMFSVQANTGDTVASEATITITVTAPDGNTTEDEITIAAGSSSGETEIEVQLFELATRTIEAADQDAARTAAIDALPAMGMGTWTVDISISGGGDPLGAVVAPSFDVSATMDPLGPEIESVSPETPNLEGAQ